MNKTLIARWKDYGVRLEQDSDGQWRWSEITEDGEEGVFSLPFASFEAAVSDVERVFGPLSENER